MHRAQNVRFCAQAEAGCDQDLSSILKLNQNKWLKAFIELHTRQRTLVTNDYEKNFVKLACNSIYNEMELIALDQADLIVHAPPHALDSDFDRVSEEWRNLPLSCLQILFLNMLNRIPPYTYILK